MCSTTNTSVSTQNTTISVCHSLATRKSRTGRIPGARRRFGRGGRRPNGSAEGDVVDDDALVASRLVDHVAPGGVDQLALEQEELGRLVVPDLGGLLVVPQPLLRVEGDTRLLHQLVEGRALVVSRPGLVDDAARPAQAPQHAV